MNQLVREAVDNQTDVSFSLARHVISTHAKDENFVFSPLSFHVVLGLLASGSNAPTRAQLLGFLKSKSTEELNFLCSQVAAAVLADGEPVGGPRLSFANGVWIDRSFCLKASFKQIVENNYMAATTQVDFKNKAGEVIKEVNAWADKETNGLIKEILPPGSVNSTTMLILGNAMYFKGVWDQKFDASLTKDHDFFPLYGSPIKAQFMTSKNKQYIRAFDGFKVLGMPYRRGGDARAFTMNVFLPDARDGLPSLVDRIGSEPRFFQHHLPDKKVMVGDFRIPKFKVGFGFEASGVFKALGVVGPFSNGGLSETADDPSIGQFLCVDRIFHKAFIEVNEEGTEAAAVTMTAVAFGCSMYRPHYEEIDFVADHPFMFVIREDFTGVVLFIGQVVISITKQVFKENLELISVFD